MEIMQRVKQQFDNVRLEVTKAKERSGFVPNEDWMILLQSVLDTFQTGVQSDEVRTEADLTRLADAAAAGLVGLSDSLIGMQRAYFRKGVAFYQEKFSHIQKPIEEDLARRWENALGGFNAFIEMRRRDFDLDEAGEHWRRVHDLLRFIQTENPRIQEAHRAKQMRRLKTAMASEIGTMIRSADGWIEREVRPPSPVKSRTAESDQLPVDPDSIVYYHPDDEDLDPGTSGNALTTITVGGTD